MAFEEAATLADELLKVPLASVQIQLSTKQLLELNSTRARFHQVMTDLLPAIAGEAPPT